MDVMQIMKRSWRLLWTNKYLWFFGLFVAGGGGAGGESGGQAGGAGAGTALPQWLWPLLTGLAVFGLAMLFMHVVSEGALIEGVRRRERDEAYGIRAGLRVGLSNFWGVLKLKLLVLAMFVGAAAVIAAPALLSVAKVLPLWLGIPLTVLLAVAAMPVFLTLYVMYEYALRFTVLEGAPAVESLRAAKRFLHGRVRASLLLLLAWAAGAVAGGAAAVIAAIPAAAVGLALGLTVGLVPGIVTGAAVFIPLLLPLLGATGTYRSAVWTLGFLDARAKA